MKLELSLPERPGFLHAVAVVNLFALLLMFILLGPSLTLRSGVTVDLPPSRFQLDRYTNTLVVTLGPGNPAPRIHFGRDAVTQEELGERLEQLREGGAPTDSIVLLQTDAGTPVKVEREISELALSKGFRVALVGQATEAPNPD
ncbi:biopolymer transporter ExbD [Luteolibacter pohnpeiensis]|uniref:Biopolymer transporter ExbD n=1 Tax=Luteolibacter pohnpeiensis TaxID=454153 RepID=A0A934SC52_9BACT|nr:biopolymer transporter ExbD [Luteolibacter pohnpeiensis]MBK1883194.1 biopolymer transporter ExbD [Luteolibacter pohnpeiensis]